jgi:hypothetical protein
MRWNLLTTNSVEIPAKSGDPVLRRLRCLLGPRFRGDFEEVCSEAEALPILTRNACSGFCAFGQSPATGRPLTDGEVASSGVERRRMKLTPALNLRLLTGEVGIARKLGKRLIRSVRNEPAQMPVPVLTGGSRRLNKMIG